MVDDSYLSQLSNEYLNKVPTHFSDEQLSEMDLAEKEVSPIVQQESLAPASGLDHNALMEEYLGKVPEFDEEKYEAITSQQEPWYTSALKGLGASAARGLGNVASTVAGIPGAFQERIHSKDVDIAEQVAQMAGQPFNREEFQALQQQDPQGFFKLPAQEKIKKSVVEPVMKKTFGEGYEEARNPLERGIERFTENMAYLMMPLGGAGMAAKTAAKAAGLGAIARTGADIGGAGPIGQTAAEMLGIFSPNMLNLVRPGTYKEGVTQLYKEAGETAAKKPFMSEKIARPVFKTAEKFAKRGWLPEPIKKNINTIESLSAKGKTPVSELIDLEKNINSYIFERPSTGFSVGKLSDLNKKVSSALESYGKSNPEFLKNYSSAKSLFKTLKKSDKISAFLKSTNAFPLLTKAGGGLGLGAATLLGYGPKLISHLPHAAGAATLYGMNFLRQMGKDPAALSLMKKLSTAAVKEKKGAAVKLATQLADYLNEKQSQ